MPRPRIGTVPMNPAERQARRRAKLRQQNPRPPVAPTRTHRPAADTLVHSGGRFARSAGGVPAWLENLSQNLESSGLADKLQAIVELDLEELQVVGLPLGFGRD